MSKKLELDRVEIWDERPGEPRVLRKKQPIFSIMSGNGPQLFLQHGCVFGGDGQMLKPEHLPDWFESEIGRMTPEALASCEFDLKKWKSASTRRRKLEAAAPKEVENGGNVLADDSSNSARSN